MSFLMPTGKNSFACQMPMETYRKQLGVCHDQWIPVVKTGCYHLLISPACAAWSSGLVNSPLGISTTGGNGSDGQGLTNRTRETLRKSGHSPLNKTSVQGMNTLIGSSHVAP